MAQSINLWNCFNLADFYGSLWTRARLSGQLNSAGIKIKSQTKNPITLFQIKLNDDSHDATFNILSSSLPPALCLPIIDLYEHFVSNRSTLNIRANQTMIARACDTFLMKIVRSLPSCRRRRCEIQDTSKSKWFNLIECPDAVLLFVIL